MTTKLSPNFKQALKGAVNEEKVVPILRTELWNPDFQGFTVEVEGFTERKPDGWFHPSTHPLWTEPHLYYYILNHENMIREPFDPTGTLAVTFGHFAHTFVQQVLIQSGVLVQQPEKCPCGYRHSDRAEVYLVDEEVKSRGHSDGVLKWGDGFEFKTMNPRKAGTIPKGAPSSPEVLEWFKKRCKDYYLQAQEYLRISGRTTMVVVILVTTYPFEMREIHVPYNPRDAMATRDKFARVLQAVADGNPPPCECGPKNNVDCPVRSLCWEPELLGSFK